MAIARTGVYVDDYLECKLGFLLLRFLQLSLFRSTSSLIFPTNRFSPSLWEFTDASTLPAELQRLLNTIRELDERSQGMINQTRQQTKYCLGMSSQSSKKGHHSEDDEAAFEKLRREIEASQDNALSLCTEKVLLARQAHDLVTFLALSFSCFLKDCTSLQIDSHIKRLDEDLNNFAEDLKHEGKIPQDEPAILPPLPIVIVPKTEKRRITYGTPQSRRFEYRDRDWERERERDKDSELMPPPGSHKKDFAVPVDIDQPIDPNEPIYCICHQVSFGDMIACDNENVSSSLCLQLLFTTPSVQWEEVNPSKTIAALLLFHFYSLSLYFIFMFFCLD
ncbi:hypothetical protein Cgig2_031806 [Carnegiea gigantea]|uniref:Inhibitor of growth protein N-terminal histone-binding domain-containing protein n=1 Tax=Carnegiea gigantea TaxID=171969 RepID=A0A9Q1KT01_9CARY|nr:hypothetical protein Cgig2_031806 [Carnegiea gigantea]